MSALAWYTVSWMKLVSYMQVNWWCRTSYRTRARGEPGELTSAVSLPQVRCSNSVEEKLFLIHAASPNKKAKRLVQYPDNLNVKGDMLVCLLCFTRLLPLPPLPPPPPPPPPPLLRYELYLSSTPPPPLHLLPSISSPSPPPLLHFHHFSLLLPLSRSHLLLLCPHTLL